MSGIIPGLKHFISLITEVGEELPIPGIKKMSESQTRAGNQKKIENSKIIIIILDQSGAN